MTCLTSIISNRFRDEVLLDHAFDRHAGGVYHRSVEGQFDAGTFPLVPMRGGSARGARDGRVHNAGETVAHFGLELQLLHHEVEGVKYRALVV